MNKIIDAIDIMTSYSSQVDLKEEFTDNELNLDRMSKYKPIKAHRKPFIKIAEEINLPNSKRSFILSGSYGTGKSHLLLMLANYFNNNSKTKEMEEFFKNFSEALSEDDEEDVAARLQQIRSEGKYLICICDYERNTHFESTILRAIKDALGREKIEMEELDSYYAQAVEKINILEKDHHFSERIKELLASSYPGWNSKKLKKHLMEYDRDAIDIFKDIHKKVTFTDFEYDKDNLNEIIKQIIKSKAIKEKYKGIIILFDEFDYQLKNDKFDINVFQSFAQMCSISYQKFQFPVCFVATTHRSFASYKSSFNSQEYSKASDRVDEIELETDGVEDIISAIVHPKKNSDTWTNVIDKQKSSFTKLAVKCGNLSVFNNLKAKKLSNKIIENIFPMHPMATYALMKIASDFGSNNRSVITFFSNGKEEKGSYDWYIKNNKILNDKGQLNFYTVDLLFSYFESKIDSNNGELRPTIRDYVKNYESSLKELDKIVPPNNDEYDFLHRVLKTIFIYDVIGGVKNNIDTISFGLNANTEAESNYIKEKLSYLDKNRILFFDNVNGYYEFRRNDTVDISRLINDFKNEPKNNLTDIVDELTNLIETGNEIRNLKKFLKEEILSPNSYNTKYQEDKRVKMKYVTFKEFSGQNYLQLLSKDIDNIFYDENGVQGMILNVICKNKEEIEKAISIAEKNTINKIIISIPNEPIILFDDVFTLKACLKIDTQEFTTQDNDILKDNILRNERSILEKIKKFVDSKNITYFNKNFNKGILNSEKANEAVSNYLEKQFDLKRNKFSHIDFNSMYKNKKNNPLKEAIDKMLNNSNRISYDTNAKVTSGDISYIKNVLVENNILFRQHEQGEIIVCEINSEFDKIKNKFPSLYDMYNEILKSSVEIKIKSFANKYIYEYGIGKNAFMFMFSTLLRYFGDSISFMRDIDSIHPIEIKSFDDLNDLITDKSFRNSYFIYEALSKQQIDFIQKIDEIFNNDSSVNKPESTLSSAYKSISLWFDKISNVSKIHDIYENKVTETFVNLLNNISEYNSRKLILNKLQIIAGYDENKLLLPEMIDEIIEKIELSKREIEDKIIVFKNKIIIEFKKIFDIDDNSYENIRNRLYSWIENLNFLQQDETNGKHTDDSKNLVSALKKQNTLEELLFDELPSSYGFGATQNWKNDYTKNYLEKIKEAIKHISDNFVIVSEPQVSFSDNKLPNDNGSIYFNRSLKIKIKPNDNMNEFNVLLTNSISEEENTYKEEIEREIKDTTRLKIYCFNEKGDKSKVLEYELVNEDKKYHFIKYNEDNSVKVIIPTNKREFLISLTSFLEIIESDGLLKKKEINEAINEILGDENE